MKKIFYSFLPLCLLVLSYDSVQAQSFTMDKDTIKRTAGAYMDIYNKIKNETTDTISVTWRMLDHNMPQSWIDDASFGLCDNVACYGNELFSGAAKTTDTISAGAETLFKAQVDFSPSSVIPAKDIYVNFELVNGTTTDTVTFVLNKWTASVSNFSNTKDNIILYPNPAQDKLNITYSRGLNVNSIAVYNLVGKQMNRYPTVDNRATIDIEKIPSGIYFVRLIDNQGQVVATRRFTHQ